MTIEIEKVQQRILIGTTDAAYVFHLNSFKPRDKSLLCEKIR